MNNSYYSRDMVRDPKLRIEAESLRRQGFSYLEIKAKLGVPKSTLSGWFAGNRWSRETRDRLNTRRIANSAVNLLEANRVRRNNDKQRWEKYRESARAEFEKKVVNPLFLVGLSLYWGEGDKTNNGRVSVINTDPEVLSLVASFYQDCLGISIDKLRAGLFIYPDMNKSEALRFWSVILGIREEQFIKVQLLQSRSKQTSRKSEHGICSLYFSSTEFSIKIHEWIRILPTIVLV